MNIESNIIGLAELIKDQLRCSRHGCRCHAAKGNLHCPSHTDNVPSLSLTVTSNSLLVHCFSGCSQQTVVEALKSRGFWLASTGPRAAKVAKAANDQPELAAATIWGATRPAEGTLVQAYLEARGLSGAVPSSLRFAPALLHKPTGRHLPAMVAGVARWPESVVAAIHRTYLTDNGSDKAGVEPNRMALGPLRGGAVWLDLPGEKLAVAEGIETALSVQEATQIATWAVLSASNYVSLVLPAFPLAQEIVLAADHDSAGLRAAYEAAEIWTRQGRTVRVALPPANSDFNDVLRGLS